MDSAGLKEKLKTIIAGETVSWGDYERFMLRATPRTLSTLMKATEVEAYLAATQDKVVSPRMKIAIGVIFTAMIIIAIVYLIFQGGVS